MSPTTDAPAGAEDYTPTAICPRPHWLPGKRASGPMPTPALAACPQAWSAAAAGGADGAVLQIQQRGNLLLYVMQRGGTHAWNLRAKGEP